MNRLAVTLALSMLATGGWLLIAPDPLVVPPPPVAFTYSEAPMTMGTGTGIYVRIDVALSAGQSVDIEWTPEMGFPFLPIHTIRAPFPFGTVEMWSRFVVSNDTKGFYNVRLK